MKKAASLLLSPPLPSRKDRFEMALLVLVPSERCETTWRFIACTVTLSKKHATGAFFWFWFGPKFKSAGSRHRKSEQKHEIGQIGRFEDEIGPELKELKQAWQALKAEATAPLKAGATEKEKLTHAKIWQK